MFNKFKNLLKREKPAEPDPASTHTKPNKPRKQANKPKPNAKDIASKNGLPFINIISMELNPENIGIGAFELDWNEIFVAKLLQAGYKGTNEEQIVDQWFTDVCRNVVLETFEQYEANNPRPPSGVQRKNLGDGRTEIS